MFVIFSWLNKFKEKSIYINIDHKCCNWTFQFNKYQLSMTCGVKLGTFPAVLLCLFFQFSYVASSPMVDSTPKPEPKPNSSRDCQSKPKLGYTYEGETSTTVSGKQCRTWAQVQCTELFVSCEQFTFTKG